MEQTKAIKTKKLMEWFYVLNEILSTNIANNHCGSVLNEIILELNDRKVPGPWSKK